VGGTVLSQLLHDGLAALPPLLPLAERLAQILDAVHRAGVLHKDIHPGNILLHGPQREPLLIDFHLATTAAEEHPAFNHHSEIVGTLRYLAPEQTGRTGRAIDQRADLYALGATLYELATGRPPFTATDPLQLIHAHLVELPVAPVTLVPTLPQALSDIILRLLAKEPDARYQSAQGLQHDLGRLRAQLAHGGERGWPLGQRDFAWRLPAPSQLVGRAAEIAALQQAFDEALADGPRGVLVSGAPGVGKTALLNELRPRVAARRGWLVCGKFDAQRQDLAGDGMHQALRALGRLLLAEPEAEMQAARARITRALGPSGCRLAAQVPELALLLGEPPGPLGEADPAKLQDQLADTARAVLRAVVSPDRPLVMLIDDLQWAAALPVAALNGLLTDASLRGLLVVITYRSTEAAAPHPLAATLLRWARLQPPPLALALDNLPPNDEAALLADLLRLAPGDAASLAEALRVHTGGNPFDTLQLVNALRHEGVLALGEDGWHWDAAAIRRHVGQGNVLDLLTRRIAALPPQTRALLDSVACLGGEVALTLLAAATGQTASAIEHRLQPAFEDGLLLVQAEGQRAVRCRHDRVQQASLAGLDAAQRSRLHRALAERLALQPAHETAAAHQYLQALDSLDSAAQRERAARLMRQAAGQVRGFHAAMAERFLAAAAELHRRNGVDEAALLALHIEHHAVLYSLGQLAQADAVYRLIERHCSDALQLAGAAAVQISCLTNQRRQAEAVALGEAVLARLGIEVPSAAQADALLAPRSALFERWFDPASQAEDLQRPSASDARIRAAGLLLNRMMPPAFFCTVATLARLVLVAQALWRSHGPAAEFIGPLSHAGFVAIGLWQDHRTGAAIGRRMLAVSEARGYHAEAAQTRFLLALGALPWTDPLEDSATTAHRAHEGLLATGDQQNAGFTFFASLYPMVDCAPTLERYGSEVDAALAFSSRTGNDQSAACFLPHRQLLRMMRGQTAQPGSFDDAHFQQTAHAAQVQGDPVAAANFHIVRALGAALWGDTAALAEHAALSMSLVAALSATYPTALARVLQGLALAQRVRSATPAEQAAWLQAFDACHDWLADRAADAPVNFLHLVRWLRAERAWAMSDFATASNAFDAALDACDARQRPWHRALIAERAALFLLEHGLRRGGTRMMAEAHRRYQQWGADAKVEALEQQHAFLRSEPGHRAAHAAASSNGISGHSIDMLGVLRASQALSSETHIGGLKNRVVQLLATMTGATSVLFVLRNEDDAQWQLAASLHDGVATPEAAPVSVEEAGARGLLPLSVLRYAGRTGAPLLVGDATQDDRFMQDPYIAARTCCSLLAVPILSRGTLRALLLLENRLGRHAFSANRLEAVMLIGGQLAVSLDNALLYASLERKVAERTEALEEANRQLATLSVTDALTGVANRRRFDEVLKAEWQRALRSAQPLGAAMVDIDQFKRYNDHYGHAAGDACLRDVARSLQQGLRQDIDLLARYGGEEFAIIVPGADRAAVHQVAERAREAVAAAQRPHAEADHRIVTVSIGVAAMMPSPERSPQDLFAAADAALYDAKRNGRNRVEGG
jgi:diguanylate cyclase (GGDEF)-like protein